MIGLCSQLAVQYLPLNPQLLPASHLFYTVGCRHAFINEHPLFLIYLCVFNDPMPSISYSYRGNRFTRGIIAICVLTNIRISSTVISIYPRIISSLALKTVFTKTKRDERLNAYSRSPWLSTIANKLTYIRVRFHIFVVKTTNPTEYLVLAPFQLHRKMEWEK